MTQELSQIRIQIDAIDNQVHDLLMERASLVSSVAAAKRKEGLQIVQPAREARMIRRLLRRHSGPLPEATIVRIWRELVGSVSLLQTGLSVAIAANKGESQYWDMAKNYFGSAVPMKKVNGDPHTVGALREDEASFAVVPWPEVDDRQAWWVLLLDQQQGDDINIICALPYGSENSNEVQTKALVISKIDYMPSDEDNSFIGLKLSTNVSRAKLNDTAVKAGFKPLNIYTAGSPHEPHQFHLIEVQGYHAKRTHELEIIKEGLEGVCLYCDVVGGYPVIPELKKARIG